MLRRVGESVDPAGAVTAIGEARFPAPFSSGLEFNAPVHGVWNIVHTGMLLPESHQIYVCAYNCMRGVVLTAAEMNEAGRFSQVIVEERDLLAGRLEKVTVEGVTDVLRRLPQMPRAVLLFTVCIHHFLGSDLNWIYEELGRRFPDVAFVRCYMDPIMRKSGATPDMKMRRSLYDLLPARPADPKSVSLLGSDFAADETGDLAVLLRQNGFRLRELPRCRTFDEYLEMGESALFLSVYPSSRYGAEILAKRLDRPLLYLPASFRYEEIQSSLRRLAEALGVPAPDGTARIAECEAELAALARDMRGWQIVIDYTFHPRPLGLARLLLDRGFDVRCVWLDVVSGEEEEDFRYLQCIFPELRLAATVHPKGRVLPRHMEGKVLALGQKAAWFSGSRHFVNLVEGAGWYGFDGIRKLMAAMRQAMAKESEPEEDIVRKGWGCESCI